MAATVPSGLILDQCIWSGSGVSFEASTTPSTIAHVSAPGQYSVSCSMYAHATGQTPRSIYINGSNSEYFLTVGGPIDFEIVQWDEKNYTPLHDDYDESKPWYAQYFYNYNTDPNSSSKPQYAQLEQHVTVQPLSAQVQGTTIDWVVGSMDTIGQSYLGISPQSNGQFPILHLRAKGDSTSTIKCTYHGNWFDPSLDSSGNQKWTTPTYFSFQDDTAVTHDAGYYSNN